MILPGLILCSRTNPPIPFRVYKKYSATAPPSNYGLRRPNYQQNLETSWFLLFPLLPYFWIPTRMIDGENLYKFLIFISREMNHEREFLYDHAAHLSVTYGIHGRVALQRIDLDYYLFWKREPKP